MPPVRAPSPITATATPSGSTPASAATTRLASRMPRAAEMEVEAWPVSKASWGLSARLGKPEMPPDLRMLLELLAAPGEELVRVALVPDVPDHGVAGRIEDPVDGEGQLDHAEVGREMPAVRA